jgi:hypothetical protein
MHETTFAGAPISHKFSSFPVRKPAPDCSPVTGNERTELALDATLPKTWEPSERGRLRATLDALADAMEDRHQADAEALELPRTWLIEAGRSGAVGRAWSSPYWAPLVRTVAETADPEARGQVVRLLVRVIDVAGVELLNVRDPMQMRIHFAMLHGLTACWRSWLRPVEDWSPAPGLDAAGLFRSLTHHLYARFPVPEILETVWIAGGRKWSEYRPLYLHLAAGGSMRDAPLPYRLGRRAAHAFLQAPADMTIPDALTWASLTAIGVDAALHEILSHTRLATQLADPRRREFWMSVAAFLVRHPEFAATQATNLIDYLEARKFGVRISRGARGRDPGPPVEPELTLKGRTPASLLRDMELWHVALGRVRLPSAMLKRAFRPSGLKGLDLDLPEASTLHGHPRVRIVELVTAQELLEEGAAMHHCVLSYAGRCLAGECSIWSLRTVDADGREHRRLTIEVSGTRLIRQVRGPYNRAPSEEEARLVHDWCKLHGVADTSAP